MYTVIILIITIQEDLIFVNTIILTCVAGLLVEIAYGIKSLKLFIIQRLLCIFPILLVAYIRPTFLL